MKKIAFALVAVSFFFASCSKKDADACYTCTKMEQGTEVIAEICDGTVTSYVGTSTAGVTQDLQGANQTEYKETLESTQGYSCTLK